MKILCNNLIFSTILFFTKIVYNIDMILKSTEMSHCYSKQSGPSQLFSELSFSSKSLRIKMVSNLCHKSPIRGHKPSQRCTGIPQCLDHVRRFRFQIHLKFVNDTLLVSLISFTAHNLPVKIIAGELL